MHRLSIASERNDLMNHNHEMVLGFSKSEKLLVVFLPVLSGGLIGWFIPVIAGWILKLPIVPWGKLVELIASFNSVWVSIVAALIGIAGGIWLAFVIFAESLEVTISFHSVRLKLGDRIETIAKKDISAIFMEKKQIVFLGTKSNELYRGILETKVDKAHEAFHRYQYPWCEKDPFEGQYQRWVLGHPDFPENVNTLLHARERALKEDEEKDAKHLREDLAKLGAIIKDEKKAQYVRMAHGINHGS
ncbi:hypothetical protein ACFSMW_19695 [Virgibacillus halophilus]|uniref:YqeB family protein n=1 Tax=Tigheibacillus halophilus TaxID=361280 RepID=UPI003630F525